LKNYIMKKYFYSLVVLTVLSLSGLQAQTTTYTLAEVGGTITLNTITDQSGSTTFYSGGAITGTPLNGGGQGVIFNFSGTLTPCGLNVGDTIEIPFSISSDSHFQYINLDFNSNLTGFTVTTDGYSTIYLTATAATPASPCSEITYTLQGVGTFNMGNSLSQISAIQTDFTFNGTTITLNSTEVPLQKDVDNYRGVSSSASTTGDYVGLSTGFNGLYYVLMTIKNENTANSTNSGEPYLGGDYSSTTVQSELNTQYLELDTICPQTPADAILNISFAGDNELGTNYAIPFSDGTTTDSLMTRIGGVPTTSAQSLITTCTTCASPSDLAVGERGIFKQPSGCYVVAVNWGSLYNNPFTSYIAGYASTVQSYDPLTAAVIQRGIDSLITANALVTNLNLTFVDPTKFDTAIVTATSNVPAYSDPYYYTNTNFVFTAIDTIGNIPASNALVGQTLIKIHYIDINGDPIAAVFGSGYGYSSCAEADPGLNVSETSPIDVNGTYSNDTMPSVINYPDSGAMHMMNETQVSDLVNLSSLGINSSNVLYAGSDATDIPYPCGADTNFYVIYATAEALSLPVTGLHLNAQLQNNNNALLTWETITEINCKNFTLQRSNDKGKTWVSINTQASKARDGNSSVPLSYQFADNALPVGDYLYRVVETDIDGDTTLSNTLQIQITGNGGLMIYPNPANSTVNILLPSGVNTAIYRLIGVDGKIVQTGSLVKVTGNYGQLNVSSVASGIYFVQIIVNNNIQTMKLQVQH
jgi:hypothetical protein